MASAYPIGRERGRSIGGWTWVWWCGVLVLVLLATAGCSKEAKVTRHLARGDEAFAAGDYDRARIEYLNVLQLDRQNAKAVSRVGIILFDNGMVRDAARFLAGARQLDPENVEARLRLAQVLFVAGKRKESREELKAVLDKVPDHPEAVVFLADLATNPEERAQSEAELTRLRQLAGERAVFHLLRANLLLRESDAQAAEGELKRALALDPKLAGAHQLQATFHLMRTNLVEAETSLRTAAELSSIRSGRRIRYAEFLIGLRRPDEGRKVLEGIAAKAADFLPVWTALAQLSLSQGRLADCQAEVNRVLARDAKHYEAGLLRARLHLAKQEAEAARKVLETLLPEYPGSAELHTQLALACLGMQDQEKALDSLKRAVELDPDAVNSGLLLAQLHLRRGAFDDAVEGLTALARRRPSDDRVQLALAQAYAARGRLQDALRIYQAHLQQHPKDLEALFASAVVQRGLNRPDEARRVFEQCLQLNATNLSVHAQLIELDLQAKQTNAALARAEGRVKEAPESAAAHLLLARVQLAAGQVRGAEQSLKRCIELDSNARAAYLLLAQLYVSEKRQEVALKEIRAFLERNPADSGALLLAGMLHTEQKQYEEALRNYETLLKAVPNNVTALNNLAYLYSEHLNQADKALQYAKRARELRPGDPAIADTYAWALFRKGQYREALAAMGEAASQLQGDPEVQYHLGMIQLMVGQEEAARVALRRALESTAPFNGREEAERRLATLDFNVQTADASTVARLEDAFKASPEDGGVALRLAAVYERDQAFDKARDVYTRGLKANPKHVPLLTAYGRLLAGALKEPSQALEPLQRARSLAPDDARVAWQLGRATYAAGDHARAVGLLEEAARKLPSQAAPWMDLAWARYAVGRVAEARQAMEASLQAEPRQAGAVEIKRFSLMCDWYGNPALVPDAAQVQAALKADGPAGPAFLVAGMLYQRQGNITAARQAVERVVTAFPSHSAAQRQLAILYVAPPADYAKAHPLAQKAREAYPADPETARILGITSYHRNEFRRSVQLLQDFVRQRSTDAEAYYWLGMAQLQLKETQQAKASLEQARSLDAAGSWGKQAAQALEGLE